MEYLTQKPEWDGKKILLVRLDRLGDLIVSTPAMQAVKNTFPHSQVDLLGSSLNRALFKYCDYIDNTYCYDKKHLFNAIKLIFTLRAQKYDVVICLTPHSKSTNFFVKCIGAPINLAACAAPEKFQKLYTYSIVQSSKSHILEFMQENMQNMGFKTTSLNPVINIPSSVLENVKEKFPKNPNTKRLILSIGNIKRPHKRWSMANYAEVVKYIHQKYNSTKQQIETVVMTGKGDLPLLDEFNNVPKDNYTLFIGTDIAESAAFIDQSDLFVCTSSGPSHIAASTSCSILSIITSYMYEVWRPLRKNDKCAVSDNLKDIKVEEVIEKIEEYIAKWESCKF